MATHEPTSDVTTRDVLYQVDRRLELLEGDVRSLDGKVDLGFAELRNHMDESIGGLRSHIDESVGGLRSDVYESVGGLRNHIDESIGGLRNHIDESIGGLRSHTDESIGGLRGHIDRTRDHLEIRMDMRFRWIIGLILMSWMTTMGAILFRLGPVVP